MMDPDEMLDLPVAPPPPVYDFIEYSAPGGEKWRVERGNALLQDFDLEGPEHLPRLHEAIAGQDPAWLIMRRIYAIAPLMGVVDPDEVRVWQMGELSAQLGLEASQLQNYIEGAKTFWRRWQLESGPRKAAAKAEVRVMPAVPEDEADRMLAEQGFIEIDDPAEKQYIALRIRELESYLESEHLRAPARSAIQQEVTLFFALDPAIRALRAKIRDLAERKHSAEKENEQLMRLIKSRSEAQSSLEGTLKALGMTEGQGSNLRKKVSFNDCLATLVDAMKKYYSDQDRSLVDGLFTLAEVELLITPTALRPAQYRPDLVLMALEAGQHLWEKEWSPTPLGRRTCRKLAAGFGRGLAEARAEDGEMAEAREDLEELLEELPSGVEAAPVIPLQPMTTEAVAMPRVARTNEAPAMVAM